MRRFALSVALVAAMHAPARARVILQYFETDWKEIEARLPELILAGYDALWLPPPQKGGEGVRDVGFSVFDRFDLGDKDQRGTIRTRYGTRAELLSMSDGAHRFGLRVMFDVVMNHNANPSLIETAGVDLPLVGLDGFPHTVALDYHVLPARPIDAGGYEALQPGALGGQTITIRPGTDLNPETTVAAVPMPADVAAIFPGYSHLVRAPRIVFDDNVPLFELQDYSLLGLADFALDLDGRNATTGTPLPSFIRQPDCPTCYPDGTPRPETIVEYIMRWVGWLGDTTDADGFRLDAVRHLSTQFFERFNRTIQDGYARRRAGARTAQIFGESYTGDIKGELAAYSATGMQMLNFPLFFTMTGLFSSGSGGNGDLGQLSFPQGGETGALAEFGGLGRLQGVSFAQSHDNGPPDGQPNLAYAFILTRPGDAVVFFDGNNPDPRDFVQAGRADAFGDLGSHVITDLVYVHNHFARGGMFNRFVDDDAYVYERVSEGRATLLAVLHDNIGADARVDMTGAAHFGESEPRPLIVTAFPPGMVLVDVTGNSAQHEVTVQDPSVLPPAAVARALAAYGMASIYPPPGRYGVVALSVPSGPDHGYAMYAPRVPSGPRNGARAITVLQAGQRVPDVTLRTVGEKRTAAGARVAPKDLTVAQVTGQSISIQLRTDASAESAWMTIDRPGRLPGGAQNTPDGAFDGMVPMRPVGAVGDGDRLWELGPIAVAELGTGTRVVRARAGRTAENGAAVWNSFATLLVVTKPGEPPPPTEPLDRDGDGVATAADNCPEQSNPDQADFDGDGSGDVCDFCPDDGPAPMLDADGCRALDETAAARVNHAADDVLAGRQELIELVRMIDEVNR